MDSFGDYIKQLRLDNKLTLRDLERLSGVSNAYLSQVETGKRAIPSPDILKKIHQPLNISYENLMEKAGYISSRNELTTYDLLIIKELKKYQFLYEILKMEPAYVAYKIDNVMKAFYAEFPKS